MSDVIHVVFGAGGGRIEPPVSPRELVAPGSSATPAKVFTRAEAARLLRLSPARLRRLERLGVATPSASAGPRRLYRFADVAELRAVAELLRRNVSVRSIASAVWAARKQTGEPLAALTFVADGKRLVVHSHGVAFEPLTGQALLALEYPRGQLLQFHPAGDRDTHRRAYDLYLRASELDEDYATLDEAEQLYRLAIALDPSLALAYTNLGNVRFKQRDWREAEALFRKALEVEPRQPEARYNLGYLALERGDAQRAITLLHAALEVDPSFADASFNLAMAYEQTGQRGKAQVYWRRYLELEPHGAWADRARRHLR